MCSACSGDYENPDMELGVDATDDEATLIVTQADERLRRGQELTKILMNNLGVNPFRPVKP
jgi:hypothetical protein